MPAESGPSFRFEARRARLDWRLLHSVDVDRLMRENDLDMLETTLVRARPNLPHARCPPGRASARSLTFPFLVLPSLRLTTTPRPVRPDHAKQETVAFGDVTVEDSRNLTVNNSRKILRLAQCQVEYLLHVQETLVSTRSAFEGAPRGAARVHRRQVPSRARARPRQGAQTRAANRAEGSQDVRGFGADPIGKPLEEILTGAIVSPGRTAKGPSLRAPGTASACPRRPWTRASCPPSPRSRARRRLRATAATEEEEEEEERAGFARRDGRQGCGEGDGATGRREGLRGQQPPPWRPRTPPARRRRRRSARGRRRWRR